MGPGVVELMQDIRVDATCAPLAVVRLGRSVPLDRHVIGVDLRPDAIEQDPPFAPDRGSPDTAGQ